MQVALGVLSANMHRLYAYQQSTLINLKHGFTAGKLYKKYREVYDVPSTSCSSDGIGPSDNNSLTLNLVGELYSEKQPKHELVNACSLSKMLFFSSHEI